MWRIAVVGIVGACGFQITTGGTPSDDQPPIDASDDVIDSPLAPWLPGSPYRRRIDVRTGEASTFADFAMAIILPSDPGLAARARDDGQDLIVTTADATPLEYELEKFDGGDGALVLWVRVPLLAPQIQLYLYYGGTDIRLHDPRATWVPQTYRAVWHMSDTTINTAKDSAGQHDLTSPGASSTPQIDTAGIAGSARSLDGTNDSLRDNDDDNTLDFGMASFSWSVWVNVAMSAGDYDMPLYKGGSSAGQPGFDMELGNGGWRTYIGDGSENRAVTFCEETLGSWVHLTGVADRTSQQLIAYTNGVFAQMDGISDIGAVASNDALVVGTNTGNNYWFRGRLDELRIYARTLTPEWIAAEHRNLRMPGAFAAVGAEEMAP